MSVYDLALVATSGSLVGFASNGSPAPSGVCSGLVKLAQRWLLEFLTVQGSMPLQPTRGCLFAAKLAAGAFDTELSVFTTFTVAASQIATNLRADEQESDTAAEKYGGASLLSVSTMAGGALVLRVSLRNSAGSSVTLAVQQPGS